jgi:DNA-binding beta-propeller fold protein YncE
MRSLRIALLVLAAVAGCGKSYGPKDIQLTIGSASSLTDADVAAVKTLDIAVTGSFNQVQTVTLPRAMARVEKIVIHLPSAHGDVIASVLGRDAQSLIVSRGASASVHLDVGDSHTAALALEPMANHQHVESAVALAPGSFTLFTGQTAQLGADGETLAWTTSDGGAITADGLFTAPASAGTFHAVGKSLLYPTDKGTVTLTVLANGIARYAGGLGGTGTVDGIGDAARVNQPRGLVPDGKGGYFFTDDGQTVRRLDLATRSVTTLAGKADVPLSQDGIGAAAGFVSPSAIVFDGNDTLYVAESASQIIRAVKVSTGEATVLAGMRNVQGTMDGVGTAAMFRWPTGIAYDPAKKLLYVGEDLAHTIRTIDVATAKVTTVAGTASMAGFKDGPAAQALFNNPRGLLFDPAGALYIIDDRNAKLRKWDLSSNLVSTLVSNFSSGGVGLDGQGHLVTGSPLRTIDVSSGAETRILDANKNEIGDWVNSVSVGSDGSYLIGSIPNIVRFDAGTRALSNVAGFDFHWSETEGPRATARLSSLNTLAVRADGTVFARDDRLVRIDADGNVKNVVRTNQPFIGWDGGMVFAADGALYALARSHGTIVKIDVDTGTYADLVGKPDAPGYADGVGAAAQFDFPNGITTDGGKIYVSDSNNQVIRAVDIASRTVTTLAGSAGMCGDTDQTGNMARFCGPQGILADGAGNLLVADNNRIRKIVISSAVVSTIVGIPGQFGYVDGPVATAKFWGPRYLALDAAHKYLYVGEAGTTAIRRVDMATRDVTTLAGGSSKPQVVEGPLPGQINQPGAMAFLPNGDLLVAIPRESAIVQIRLP